MIRDADLAALTDAPAPTHCPFCGREFVACELCLGKGTIWWTARDAEPCAVCATQGRNCPDPTDREDGLTLDLGCAPWRAACAQRAKELAL